MTQIVSKHTMFLTRHDLKEEVRQQIVEFLNETLAATSDLYSQIKQAHWNVKGPQFYSLHTLFDTLGEEMSEYVDMVAERITALGGVAQGTVRMAAANSFLKEYPINIVDGLAHVSALADRYGAYGKIIRDGIDQTADWGDADTADLLTEISRTVDKRLWFLESHLQ